MQNIIFRWPEEVIQHGEPEHFNSRSYKSDDYLDNWPAPSHWNQRSDKR
jgi:hypothetical protein